MPQNSALECSATHLSKAVIGGPAMTTFFYQKWFRPYHNFRLFGRKCIDFLYPATSKVWGIMLYPPKKNCIQVSIRLSVCQSVSVSFLGSFLSIYRPIFFNLCIGVHIRKEWFGIEDGLISSNKYRVMALDLR